MTSHILCAYSGIEFPVPHFRLSFTRSECTHPIFTSNAATLLHLVETDYIDGKLSATENYLLYLALFNTTGHIDFRCAASQCENTASLVATNMVPLTEIVREMLATSRGKFEILHLPHFVISPDTKFLESSADWITIWKQAYADYRNNYRTATELQKLEHKESLLERKIKDKNKDISTYARDIALWAADAGKFPVWSAGLSTELAASNKLSTRTSLRDYWIYIIISCCRLESIWNIPDEDILELTQHCEDEIPHGSIYAATLMALLRAGLDRKRSFFGLDSSTNAFRVLDANASVEDANKLALIAAAPTAPPIESQYPNKLAFIKAKMNYRMAQEYNAGLAASSVHSETLHATVEDIVAVSQINSGEIK